MSCVMIVIFSLHYSYRQQMDGRTDGRTTHIGAVIIIIDRSHSIDMPLCRTEWILGHLHHHPQRSEQMFGSLVRRRPGGGSPSLQVASMLSFQLFGGHSTILHPKVTIFFSSFTELSPKNLPKRQQTPSCVFFLILWENDSMICWKFMIISKRMGV